MSTMRVATNTVVNSAIDTISQRQAQQVRTQQQIASGKRLTTPAEDPLAATQAERTRSQLARIEHELRGIGHARQLLSGAETAIADAGDTLQSVRDSMLAVGSPALGPGDRQAFAQQLRASREALLGIANRSDGAGTFVFGGQGSSVAPFRETTAGVAYVAQSGQQQVGSMPPSPVSFDGASNFTEVRGAAGSENIFSRLDAAIAVLEDPASDMAAVSATVSTTVGAIDTTFDRLQQTRVMIGERLRGLDVDEQALQSGSLDTQARLSKLVDVDYAEAIGQLSMQSTALEAAMKSYAQVSRLSLFNFI